MLVKGAPGALVLSHWKRKVVMMPTLSAPEVVVMTTYDATDDIKVGIMTTLCSGDYATSVIVHKIPGYHLLTNMFQSYYRGS